MLVQSIDVTMHTNYFSLVPTALIALLLPVDLRAQQSDPPIPELLAAAIRKVAANAVLVAPEEVDTKACAPAGPTPSLVRGDFDGDGREDYAALLKLKETGKEAIWAGHKLKEAKFSFVLFISDVNGGYKPRVVRSYTDFVPTAVVLDLQAPGAIRNRETRKYTNLSNPGVTLSFCEKSATTYFIKAGAIKSIPVAD